MASPARSKVESRKAPSLQPWPVARAREPPDEDPRGEPPLVGGGVGPDGGPEEPDDRQRIGRQAEPAEAGCDRGREVAHALAGAGTDERAGHDAAGSVACARRGRPRTWR